MEETSVAGDPGPDAGTSTAPNAAPEPVARRQRILFVGGGRDPGPRRPAVRVGAVAGPESL